MNSSTSMDVRAANPEVDFIGPSSSLFNHRPSAEDR